MPLQVHAGEVHAGDLRCGVHGMQDPRYIFSCLQKSRMPAVGMLCIILAHTDAVLK